MGRCNTPPPPKVKKGAQLAGRGLWHAGIANFFKNEGFLPEEVGKGGHVTRSDFILVFNRCSFVI